MTLFLVIPLSRVVRRGIFFWYGRGVRLPSLGAIESIFEEQGMNLADPWIVTIGGTVIGGVILYYVMRVLTRNPDSTAPKPKPDEATLSWSSAERIAIETFKAKRKRENPDVDWKYFDTIDLIESRTPEKDRKILTLAWRSTSISRGGYLSRARVFARYEIVIDRSGDVLGEKKLPAQEGDVTPYGDPELEGLALSMHELAAFGGGSVGETKIVVREVKKPIVVDRGDKTEVKIGIVIENLGRKGKTCPYVEFQAVVLQADGSFNQEAIGSEPKAWEVDTLAKVQINYSFSLEKPSSPLLEPPHQVKVELYECPESRTS